MYFAIYQANAFDLGLSSNGEATNEVKVDAHPMLHSMANPAPQVWGEVVRISDKVCSHSFALMVGPSLLLR